MIRHAKRTTLLVALAAGVAVGLVGVGAMIGAMVASNPNPGQTDARRALPEGIPLAADSSSVGKNISIATGAVYADAEGIFVLDHLTGRLSCFIVDPRNLGTKLIGQFQADVLTDLGLEKGKDPDYVLAVGGINPIGRTGTSRPALCIAYVADGNTGNLAGYSLLWNETSARQSLMQGGPLVKVMLAKARPNVATE